MKSSPATVLLFELKLCSTSHYHSLYFRSACIYPFNVLRAQTADRNTIFGETVNLHFGPQMQNFRFSTDCPRPLPGAPECFGKVPWSVLGPSRTSYYSPMAENRKPKFSNFFGPDASNMKITRQRFSSKVKSQRDMMHKIECA